VPEVIGVKRGLVLVVGALALVALAGCTADGAVESGDNQGFVSSSAGVDVIPAADREAAPEVSGTTLDGDDVALSDFAGDVVVLNVWGSWCPPCRAEAEALQEVYRTRKDQGVQFLGINTRDQPAAAKAFEDGFGIGYPSWDDADGEIQLAFRETLPPQSIPSTIVIDRDGRVAARIVGPTTYSQLSGLVDDVAAEK
jgi:peroxiredoxin